MGINVVVFGVVFYLQGVLRPCIIIVYTVDKTAKVEFFNRKLKPVLLVGATSRSRLYLYECLSVVSTVGKS